MKIDKIVNGTEIQMALGGRLDTMTAPQLEEEINSCIGGATKLDLDIAELDYVSSAGLRVLLSAQKIMNKQGNMTIKNVKPDIMEIFDVTGFVDILNIEE